MPENKLFHGVPLRMKAKTKHSQVILSPQPHTLFPLNVSTPAAFHSVNPSLTLIFLFLDTQPLYMLLLTFGEPTLLPVKTNSYSFLEFICTGNLL